MNITIEFFIFKLLQVPIFSLNWQLRFFGPNMLAKGSYFQSKTDKIDRHHHWILHIWIGFCIKFHFEQTILNLWTKFTQEKYWSSKTEKVNIITIESCIFRLVLVPNSSFWSNLPKKGFSGLKRKKGTPLIFHTILHIQISQARNFSSNWQFWFFGSNLPKKVFPVENRKSEHYYEILHIWISVGTEFQLKHIILSFWTKFTQKRYFLLKTEQAVQGLQIFGFCVVNVHSTVVFKHFEDLKDLIVLKILKEKLVMSCLLRSFYLKIV